MNTRPAARFKHDEPLPLDLDPFPTEKIKRVLSDTVESLQQTTKLTDGTRSLQVRVWAKALEATVTTAYRSAQLLGEDVA